jgi:predicted PurR-regulated permease PerM
MVTGVAIGVIYMMLPFLNAILWGGILAALLHPIHMWLRGKGWSELKSALSTTIGAILIILIPLGLFLGKAGFEIYEFVIKTGESGITLSFESLAAQADDFLRPYLARINVTDFQMAPWIQENREAIQSQLSSIVLKGAPGIVTLILDAVIAVLTLFFFLKDGHYLINPTFEMIPLPKAESEKIMLNMKKTVHAVFRGQLLVALVQAAIATVVFLLLGVKGAFMWGLITLVCSAIPMLGPPLAYIPVTLILFADGKQMEAGIMLGVGLLFLSQIDAFLKPKFIGDDISLHPMGLFFALLGGVLTMGPIGLVAGPVILTLALAIVDVLVAQSKLDRIARGEPAEPDPEPA